MHVDALEGVRRVAPRWTGRHSEGRWFISVRGPATIAVLRESTAAQVKNTRARRRYVIPFPNTSAGSDTMASTATSAVDLDTDQAIQEIIRGPQFAHVTMLIIAYVDFF